MIEIPKDIFADVPSKCKECSKSHKDWLAEHDKQIRNEVIEKFVDAISNSEKGHWRATAYEHGEVVSETISYDIGTIRLIAKQMKGEQNE